jgi:hypothetical protein
MASAYVPAWRKLGLKLKSEQNGPASQATIVPSIETSPTAKRRKLFLPNGIGDQIRAQASRRPAETPSEGNAPSADTSPLSKTGESARLNGTSASVGETERRTSLCRSSSYEDANSPRKRKSVSFTPDTKLQDGGKTLKELFLGRELDSASIFESYAGADMASSNQETREVITPPKRTKKKKKSKSTVISDSAASEDQPPADLSSSSQENPKLKYLTEYHTSR